MTVTLQDVIMLVTGMLGTLGFSILFYIRPRRLPLACLGGLLTCGVYLIVSHWVGNEFIANFVGASVGSVYSELCARKCRVPVSVYTTPCVIPLVPGGMLYKTMSSLVQNDFAGAGNAGLTTLTVALGIAAGIAAGSLCTFLAMSVKRRIDTDRKKHTGQTDFHL